jgi:hypothetical protein
MKVLFLASSALVIASVSAVCDFDKHGSTREQCISSGCYWVESTDAAQCQRMDPKWGCYVAFGNETLCEGMAWESEYWQGRLNCTWSVLRVAPCAWDGPVAPTPAFVTVDGTVPCSLLRTGCGSEARPFGSSQQGGLPVRAALPAVTHSVRQHVTPPPTVASCQTQRSQQDCTNFDSACAWLTIQSSTFGGCLDSRIYSNYFETACELDGKHLSSSDPTCANVEMHDQAGVHVCKYNAGLGCTCGSDRHQPPQHGCTW